MPALGDDFRSAREARGLTLSDVAERLHIRDVYLAAIENEDWNAIGAPVYVRGFLRTYARFLGLDPEESVARFGATATPSGTARTVDVTKGSRAAAARERRGPSLPALVAILIAVALIAVAGYEYVQYRSEGSLARAPRTSATSAAKTTPASAATAEPIAAVDGATPVDGASPIASPVASPAATRSAAPALKRGLTLHLTQASWMRVTVDGSVREEGTYPAGTTRTFSGKQILVRVGNAGGVQASQDGGAPVRLGGAGDVVEREYTLSGG